LAVVGTLPGLILIVELAHAVPEAETIAAATKAAGRARRISQRRKV
jgi:hypothetical protein